MRTALLAWEIGGGFGHITALRQVALRLSAHGFRCFIAVKHVGTADALFAAGCEVLQAPTWPIFFQNERQRAAQSSVTMGDTLADAGLADAATLKKLVGAWRTLIDLTRPDLIIADYAPGAALAARGRIPLAWIGTGFTLPPDVMPNFPVLHRYHPPRWPEQQLLETVNGVAAECGLTPLQRLPQLFAGDASWVHTFPFLDPYAAQRGYRAQGPALTRTNPRGDNADEILVYFSAWAGVPEPILRTLTPVAKRTRIFAPGFPPDELRYLAGLGMRIETAPFDVAKDLAGARLVLHNGSAGIAGDAALSGVPQAICATDIEKQLNGGALEDAGVGRRFSVFAPDITLTQQGIEEILADTAMLQRAQALGETLRADYMGADPLSEFETKCLKLAG